MNCSFDAYYNLDAPHAQEVCLNDVTDDMCNITSAELDVWQRYALRHLPLKEKTFHDVGIPILILLWISGLLLTYTALDLLGGRHLQSWRVRPTTPEAIRQLTRQAWSTAVFNISAATLVFGSVAAVLKHWMILPPSGRCYTPLPNLSLGLPQFFSILLLFEVTFYYSHRLLHWAPLYRRLHHTHHQHRTPVAASFAYSHPLDALLSNVLPLNVGWMLLRPHYLVTLVWMLFSLFATIHLHSGYDVPIGPLSPRYHETHHTHPSQCFGALGIMDWIHGTDAKYWEQRKNTGKR